MRRHEKGIQSTEEIEDIIRSSQNCHLALSDNGKPYVVPMSFAYESGIIYFHTAKEGRKIEILRSNPFVCVEWTSEVELVTKDPACNWGMKFKSVIAEGKAEFITDSAEKVKALSLIMKQYSGRDDFSFPPAVVDKTEIIRITIEAISGKKSGY
jgi:uncharacterized protein